MKVLKHIAKIFTLVLVAATACVSVFGAGEGSDDPSLNYVRQIAPCEDGDISLWFDYSFRKTLTSDTVSTGMDTFSVYMAKNETESLQFCLYSQKDKDQLQAAVTDFTDGKGNSISAEIYYEMYVTVSDVNSQTVLGENIIREGETPDPIMEISRLGTAKKPAYFKLNGGKSQAFLIRLTTESATPAGWYSAQLDIKNSSGDVIKTATVYCYVWDFALSDETALKTAFYVGNKTQYGGSYTEFYDYLLDNRICAMDVPGGVISSENPYLTDPRVNSVRVSAVGGGNNNSYMDTALASINSYTDIYNELSSSSVWETVRDKLYFYNVDEPLPYPLVGENRQTVDDVKSYFRAVKSKWGEDFRFLVTPCEDFPYTERDSYLSSPVTEYTMSELKDADQEMIDTNTVQIFCPRIYAFTPYSELKAYGRTLSRENIDCIRGESIEGYSGAYGTWGSGIAASFDWNSVYGDTFDRYMSHIINENKKRGDSFYELWAYSAGYNKSYTYTNHLIENTGLQTKLLFWQAYQNGVTGYLYYGTNNWTEYSGEKVLLDTTVTGSKTGAWPVNRYSISVPASERGEGGTKYVYGNGVLFYGPRSGKTLKGVIGTLRVEILRDGIEEYQMLTMLEEYCGRDRAMDIVSSVSDNAVRYLSLSGFDRSRWNASLDEYDIMETVRRTLGNEVEAATKEAACSHKWDGGSEVKVATCLEMGKISYTCTLCGAKTTEYTPTLHEVGECFETVSEKTAGCTENGSRLMRCTLCGFEKTDKLTAHHDDEESLVYREKSAEGHSVSCSVCNKVTVSLEKHTMFCRSRKASCTEDGYVKYVCSMCGYTEGVSEEKAAGHSFENGVCIVCGEREDGEDIILGDIDGDTKLTAKDSNRMASIAAGGEGSVPAADMNGDGKVNSVDVYLLVEIISGAVM